MQRVLLPPLPHGPLILLHLSATRRAVTHLATLVRTATRIVRVAHPSVQNDVATSAAPAVRTAILLPLYAIVKEPSALPR